MKGYSKIKIINTQKSRSMDFSDVLSFPQTSKPTKNTNSDPISEAQESKYQIVKDTNTNNQECLPEQEDEAGNKERFGAVLSRNCSVSSTSGLKSAEKRASSMRRSSSVSERYCRIHDQSVTLASPIDDDDEGGDIVRATRRSLKKKHRGGKILKACKRLFGL